MEPGDFASVTRLVLRLIFVSFSLGGLISVSTVAGLSGEGSRFHVENRSWSLGLCIEIWSALWTCF